ncbi:MAG: hypothetical protein Q8R00_00800 [Candidatus Nanoarchaeia archaeon]|nr:hypothetical protein [Candidatus Nanoarchaeia archaeon]
MNIEKLKRHRFHILVIIIFVILTITALYFSGVFKKNCSDQACFDNALRTCSGASYSLVSDGNVYLYKSYLGFGDTCKLKVKMVKAVTGADIQYNKMEGKSMTCRLPREKLARENFSDMDDFAEFCAGPLKEAMYEIMIQKMYSLVIANLGEISLEAKKAVTGN